MLVGRQAERSALSDLLGHAAAGMAGLVQLVGEAGAGKSTLVTDVSTRADGFRLLRASGLAAEQPIPYGVAATLIRPLRGSLGALPDLHARALRAVLGLESGPIEGQLVLGLALLELLALAAEDAPLLVVVEDLHWCDDVSLRALGFAARRLAGERVAVVLSTRPEGAVRWERGVTLTLPGLQADEVDELLSSSFPDVARPVRQALHVRTGGNPLAVLEAARGLSPARRQGTEPLPDYLPTSSRLHEYFSARTAECRDDTRSLLLLAALEGRGDLSVLAVAATSYGTTLTALAPAERAGLVAVDGGRVVFRHPLVAASVVHAASAERHRAAHAALAVALEADGDRATWHAAAACVPPDNGVADRLAALGERALRSAAPASAASAYERAAGLTSSSALRAGWLTAAAEAALMAGETTRAVALALAVDLHALPSTQRGRPSLVRGRAAMHMGHADEAGPLLLEAARALAPPASADAWSEAVEASLQAGDVDFGTLILAEADASDVDTTDPVVGLLVARARAAVSASAGGVSALLDDIGPALQALAEADRTDPQLWNAVGAARCNIGDLAGGRTAFISAGRHARMTGDLPRLVDALAGQAFTEHGLGRWSSAVAAATSGLELLDRDMAPFQRVDLLLTLADIEAARGHEDSCRARCAQVRGLASSLGLIQASMLVERREALLDLSLNQLPEAIARLERLHGEQQASATRHPYFSAIPDLVEAYVRSGQPERAPALVAEFGEFAGPGAPPTAYARYLRSQALVAGPDGYEALFEESIALDTETGMDFFKARTLLCLGERLRRDRRRVDARRVLRVAGEIFEQLEAGGWLKRADAELAATGEVLGPRTALASQELTAQELQVALLVAAGGRNKDVAAELFLSVRTVEFHLSKVFRKLGVESRTALAARLHGG
ncbi:LuxR family transcriptional regulator [Acidothermaceae bacterium B102]|nr:LuxR family transcriptional regulator [Acidothermaceae bacterium B102]